MVEEKYCSRCEEVKAAGFFNKDKSRKSGLQSKCRKCSSRKNPKHKKKSYFGCMDHHEKLKFAKLLMKWDQENAQMV